MTYFLIALTTLGIVVGIYLLLGWERFSKWANKHRGRLNDTNTIVSLLAVAGLVFSAAAFIFQQDEIRVQQKIENENQVIYLENSIKNIDDALSDTLYILDNMPEWRTTSNFIVNRYSSPNLAKIVDNINLDRNTRATIINAIGNMDTANNLMNQLLDKNIDRSVTLDKLEDIAKTIERELMILKSQLEVVD